MVLGPEDNPIAQKLNTFFQQGLGLSTKWLAGSEALSEYISMANYEGLGANGKKNQVCMAFFITTTASGKWNYSVHYNITSNSQYQDLLGFDDNLEQVEQFIVEDKDRIRRQVASGLYFMMNMIDNLILQEETKDSGANINAKMTMMPISEFIQSDLFQNTSNGDISTFLMYPVLILYIRFVSQILTEKENRIAENLKNMGMGMTNYYFSWLSFYTLILLVHSSFFAIFVKALVLKKAQILLIFLVYFCYGLANLGLGFLITAFFTKAKPGILTANILFFILINSDTVKGNLTETVALNTYFSLSPFVAMKKALSLMVLVDSLYQPFSFNLWNTEILLYKFGIFVYFSVGIAVACVILGMYFDQVFPKEIGIRRHPCFCFMRRKANIKMNLNEDMKENGEKFGFEKVDENLASQKNENKTLEIKNLVKVYSNGKKAVKNLSLTMYSDQIFSLLGHNGAGKTTTISMISGLLPISSGSIKILGFDSVEDQDKVKTIMGVCPQKNPIYDILTVEEHLRLYAGVKKSKKDAVSLDKEIDEILADIDLVEKRNFPAGNMSGGQKRKLCVACAFIGGSKVVLLDEPSSGLDVAARRHLWEMLKKYKKNKIIILTTHFMDEADYLGDRIGVMGDGQLQACGSSLFLKNTYGVGYGLTIVKKESNVSTEKLTEVIQSHVQSAKLEGDISKEIKYILPKSEIDKFEGLFQALEKDTEALGIESFGVSLTTLEDVFLKIGDQLGHHKKKFDSKLQQMEMNEGGEDDEVELEKIRVKGSFSLFSMHLRAMIYKRMIYLRKDFKSLICEIIIPILVILIGVALSRIQFISDPVSRVFETSIFPADSVMWANNQHANLLDKLNTSYIKLEKKDVSSIEAFDKALMEGETTNRFWAYYTDLADTNNKKYDYTLFLNTTALHSIHVGLNMINNAILKDATGNQDASIEVLFKPLTLTDKVRNFESRVDAVILTFLLAMGFAFIPSSMVMFVVMEREENSKHQQIVSGVSFTSYWFGNLIVDYFKYCIVAGTTVVLILAFDVQGLIANNKLSMTISLLFMFGLTMIAFAYLTSFLFKGASSAQVAHFIYALLTGFVLMIIAFILRAIPSTRDLTLDYLEFIFRLNPMFCLCFGLYVTGASQMFTLLLRQEEEIGPWSRYGALYEFISLVVLFFVYFILIFVIENWTSSKKEPAAAKNKQDDYQEVQLNEGETDEDVLAEAEEVRTSKDFCIKVQDVAKTYYRIGSGGKVSKTRAVKGISFGVKKGDCFGLLGTNGAGKTTTFKMLSGEIQPSFGTLTINEMSVATDMKKIRHLIGYCPQFDALMGLMTTRQHLELYAAIKGIPKKLRPKLIKDKIEQLNLTNFEHVDAGTYSGGNKRKLSVAIALLGNPPVVFLDEPSSGMDPEARRFMWSVVGRISSEKKKSSVVLTTHSMEEAEALSTKLAIMVEGRIQCIGPVQRLKNKYGKGFEVETKIRSPTEADLEKLYQKAEVQVGAGVMLKSLDEVGKLLGSLGKMDFMNEVMAKDGEGAFIKREVKF